MKLHRTSQWHLLLFLRRVVAASMTLHGTSPWYRPRPLSSSLSISSLALLTSFAVFASLARGQSPVGNPSTELGRRIYREGLLPSGKPMRAVVQGDIAVEGTQLNCASCHRRSGFGSSEGAAFVPPVTGSFLFEGRALRRTDLFRKLFQEVQPSQFRARLRDPREHPAYTDETLGSALREGKDAAGRELDPLMPRYSLSDEDTAHLVAYLKSINGSPAPGVTRSTIHFATVVTEGVAQERRRAMLDVMEAYVRWKNAETKGLLAHPGHAAFYDADSYGALREWVLDVWEIRGPAKTWPRQLAEYYRQQPVFALLGGIGAGSWRPVHDFCERQEMPCLFPHTDLPVASPAGAYSLYLSGGLAVEAAALASHLASRQEADGKKQQEGVIVPEVQKRLKPFRKRTCPPTGDTTQLGTTGSLTTERVRTSYIIQVYREDADGLALADAFRRALREHGRVDLHEQVIHSARELTAAFWKELLTQERPAVLVLWIDYTDFASLARAQVQTDRVSQIYLSSTLLNEAPPLLPEIFRDKTFLTYPFTLPQAQTPHAYRARAWLRARGVAPAYERIQFNTYFTLAVVDHSLVNMAGNFSRDYFIENIEHETESTPNPGVYPRLSLGPGQRFASKGSYIVKVSDRRIVPASAWIIP